MSKRRIIVFVVILAIVGLVAGGIWWWWYRNTGERLLGRAGYALEHGKHLKALRLAERYIKEVPDEWEGYWIKGTAQSRLKRYVAARETLRKAIEADPTQMVPVRELARAYAEPALAKLQEQMKRRRATERGTRLEFKKDVNVLQEVANDLSQANDALDLGRPKDAKGRLDVLQLQGEYLEWIGETYRVLAEEHERLAKADYLTDEGRAHQRGLSESARRRRDVAVAAAKELLLDVVRQDGKRGQAAEALYRLAKQSNDKIAIAEVRKIILSMENPPPTARAQMLVDDILDARDKGGTYRAKLNQSAQVLDDLIEKNPKDLFAKRLRAAVALALGQYATADRLCKEILQVNRGHAFARLILARVMMQRGNVTDAERELYHLITQYPVWTDALVAYAEAAKAAGKKQLAIQAAQKAVKLQEQEDPDRKDTRAHQILSDLLKASGQGDEALKEAEMALVAAPDDPAALLRYVRLAKDSDEPGKAPKKLEETRKKYSTRPEVLRVVAEGYRILGNEDEAKKLTRHVAGMKATTSRGRMAVANALASLGRSPEAEVVLAAEIKENPDNAVAFFAMGKLYARQRRLAQSIEMCRRAVELDPATAQFRVGLASALLNVGDLAEAEAVLDGVAASDEGAALLRIQIAMLQGRPVDSEQVIGQFPGTKRSALILALLSYRTGHLRRCIEICQSELSTKEPADPQRFQWILAQAYLKLGQRNKAVAVLKQAIKADPTKSASYWILAMVLSRDYPPDKLQEEMRKIPSAEESLVGLAVGRLLTQQKKHALARVVYEQVAERAGAPEDVRHEARLRLAASLAQEKRLDDALKQLALLRGREHWHRRAIDASAALLIQGNRFEDAGKAVDELRGIAVNERDGALLRRTADLYVAMKAYTKAMAVAQQLLGMLPDDARTYLVQAKIHMAQDRKEDAVAAIRTAIEKQPGRMDVYRMLARLLDQDEKRTQALAVLDQLAALGKAGKSSALLERGRMLASWGLHTQAAEAFQQAVQLGYVRSPSLRLSLGRALAALGKKNEARQQLGAIPPTHRLFLTAQFLLADLAGSTEASLKILDAVDKAKPGIPQVVAKKLDLLIRADRSAEAARIVRDLVKAGKPFAAPVAALGVQAMINTGDLAGASALCVKMAAAQPRAPAWRPLAVLLLVDDQPGEAAKLLPPVAQATDLEAALGACLAAAAGKSDVARKWHGRLNQLDQELARLEPPRTLSLRRKLLTSVAAGVIGQAKQEADKVQNRGFANKPVAQEFAAHAAKDPKAAAEAVLLLKADVALALRTRQLAQKWAMSAFQARPTSLMAATLAAQSAPDKEARRKVMAAIKPADSPVAKVIQAGLLMADKQFGKAADLYGVLATQFGDDPVIEMQRALACERAGRLDQALALYTELLKKPGNVAAANNAAYLVALRYPKDRAKLQQANEWTQTAVKLAPNMPELRDTMGWIAHLQGRDQYARTELRKAVRAAPTSIENHYHLGVVERATGSGDLARWHLQAAVALGQKAKDEQKYLPASAEDAVRQAAAALAALGKPTVPAKPKSTVRVGT